MEKYVCECCGGTIDPTTMKCEYCGTLYKREQDTFGTRLRIESYTNPVETYTASIFVSDKELALIGAKRSSELALHSLVNKLAESIAPNLVVHSTYNHEFMGYDVRGTVKLVHPIMGAEHWRITE